MAVPVLGPVIRRLMGRGEVALITGRLIGLVVWLLTGLVLLALLCGLIGMALALAGAHFGRKIVDGGGFRGGGGGASGRW